MELVRTPKDWDELNGLIVDMRGSQSDLARVAIMAYKLGYREGHERSAQLYGLEADDE